MDYWNFNLLLIKLSGWRIEKKISRNFRFELYLELIFLLFMIKKNFECN